MVAKRFPMKYKKKQDLYDSKETLFLVGSNTPSSLCRIILNVFNVNTASSFHLLINPPFKTKSKLHYLVTIVFVNNKLYNRTIFAPTKYFIKRLVIR